MKNIKYEEDKHCDWCGALFTAHNQAQCLCKSCKVKSDWINDHVSNNDSLHRNRVRKAMSMIKKSKCGEIEAEARRSGKSYMDLQVQQTLNMIGKVEV